MRRKISLLEALAMPLFVFGVVVGFLIHIPFHANASGPSWQEYIYNGPAGSRPYFVYTPRNYRVGKAVPLFVMLHGCTQTPIDFAAGTQMKQVADGPCRPFATPC